MRMLFRCCFALVLLLPVLVLVHSSDPYFNDDVIGLIVFKAGLEDPLNKLKSWNQDDESPCRWDGVHCDSTNNRVTELILDGFALRGHISKGLLRLQYLQKLSLAKNNFTGSIYPALAHFWGIQSIDLSDNSLSGSIPDEFFQQCGSLKAISFAKNNFTGQIPDSLTSCSSLVSVNVSSNRLSGELPSGIWYMRGLQSLDLSNNLLEGEVSEGIQNMYDLRELSLRSNRFSGQLPGDVGECSELRLLDFSQNSFFGSLPESMQRLNRCSVLNLQGNDIEGEIPDWIGELTGLERLDLSANKLRGRIPSSIGKLQFLKELNFSMNRLEGYLPKTLSSCTSLVSIDVGQNLLTGKLPSWIFKVGLQSNSLHADSLRGSWKYPSLASAAASNQGLQVLDLSSNSFSGEIPSDIGVLSGLQFLNISRNSITGFIPESIGKLKSTKVLDLSENKLGGTIPSEIGEAVSLNELRLEKNFLKGKIPPQIAKCSSLASLILSHNNLTGPVPAVLANLTNLQFADLSFNNLSGNLPKELTNLSHLQTFNISHNYFEGELPVGGFFNTIPISSVTGNPSLCGSVVNRACPSVHPKPIVLNPNSSSGPYGPNSPNHRHRIILSISAIIAIAAAVFIAIGVVAITLLNIHARASMSRSTAQLMIPGGEEFSCSPTTDPNYGKLVMFDADADFVTGANGLLNKDSELGRGGFGVVYKTLLRDGRAVAIKKLTASGLIKSQDEFEREVKKLGTIRHQNLVSLEGYYWTPSLQLLIYEYIPNGSLYKHLHDEPNCLSWRQRFSILLGMAKGLSHLHGLNVMHYSLKSTNILIDSSGQPKVSDFGLAKLLPTLDRCILSSKIQSALGYMAPEFACRTVKITEKCDVYGFGVLVLEVVTGKRPVEYMEDDVVVLCDMVRGALEDGRVEECIDERLRGNYPAEEAIPVIKLGLVCASQVPSNRPDMSEVVNILELIQCPSEGQEDLD